jgi:hypothetical protein
MRRSAPGIRLSPLLVGCTLATYACSDASAPQPAPVDTTRVVSISRTATSADTIDATLSDALLVAVRDGKGAPIANASVRLEWSSSPGAGPVSFASAGSTVFASSVILATDAQGLARASLRLGRSAGSGFITATETSKSVKDSVALSVAPGAFFRSTVAMRDTAMLVGGAITVSGGAFDRADNALPFAFTVTGTACTLGTGGLVVGASAGTCRINLTQPVGASFRVTVVAVGLMLEAGTQGLATIRLDGTQRTPITLALYGYTNCGWVAAGNALVCVNGSAIRLLGLDGSVTPIPVTGIRDFGMVRVSQDRKWIVFNGYPTGTTGFGNATIYRARIDGSQLQVVAADCCSWIVPSFSVSPDGSVVIYSSFSTLRFDAATGTKSTITFGRERIARFSPDGSMVAYQDGNDILLSNTDGSNMRVLYTSTRPDVGPYFLHLEWSPDSKWLLTLGYGDKPFLIAADGSATLAISQPSLRYFLP